MTHMIMLRFDCTVGYVAVCKCASDNCIIATACVSYLYLLLYRRVTGHTI